MKWRGQDSNLRPRGYEPRELPGCSTPRHVAQHYSWRGTQRSSGLRRIHTAPGLGALGGRVAPVLPAILPGHPLPPRRLPRNAEEMRSNARSLCRCSYNEGKRKAKRLVIGSSCKITTSSPRRSRMILSRNSGVSSRDSSLATMQPLAAPRTPTPDAVDDGTPHETVTQGPPPAPAMVEGPLAAHLGLFSRHLAPLAGQRGGAYHGVLDPRAADHRRAPPPHGRPDRHVQYRTGRAAGGARPGTGLDRRRTDDRPSDDAVGAASGGDAADLGADAAQFLERGECFL